MVQIANQHTTTVLTRNLEHILVVDDDALIRESLCEFFNGEGFVCETADTGREALDKLLSKRFALVVSDINMPEISGLQLLEHLSRNFPDVAVIMITAQDDVETAVLAMQQGACDYIIKPFDLDRILLKVNRALRRRLFHLGQQRRADDPEATISGIHSALAMPPQNVNSQSGEFLKTPQRRLAAIMFADIVDYSALTQKK